MTIVVTSPRKRPDLPPDRRQCECSLCGTGYNFGIRDSTISYSLGSPDTMNVKCPGCGHTMMYGMFSQEKSYANHYWRRALQTWRSDAAQPPTEKK